MFQSRLILKKPINANMWVDSRIYGFHRDMYSLFPGMVPGEGLREFVYRIGKDCIYMVSKEQPMDTDGKWNIESKPYDPTYEKGTPLQFMLRAVPGIDVRDKDGKKKTYGAVQSEKYELRNKFTQKSDWPTPDQIRVNAALKWFTQYDHAFKVENVQCDLQGWTKFLDEKTKKVIEGEVLDLRGIISVNDPEAFSKVIINGLGDLRGFGFGYLMEKPA